MDKEKKRQQNAKYYRHNKEQAKRWQLAYYHKHKKEILEKKKAKIAETRRLIEDIILSYGCQNPDCCWHGDCVPIMLDFHHFDPAKKVLGISQNYHRGKKVLAREINKCVVLCANCHRMFHKGLVDLDRSMLCKADNDLLIENERIRK